MARSLLSRPAPAPAAQAQAQAKPSLAQPTSPAPQEPLGRPFAHLLAATGASNLADGMLMVGVPLLALTLTREPAQLSALTLAFTLPWLLLSTHAGLVLDRGDRVRVLLLATALRVAVLGAAALLAATGALTFAVLVGLLVVLGSAEVFADSAAGVLVPSVVPRSRLTGASSRLLGVQQVANAFVGGPVAGIVLGLGAGWLFGLPAALCAIGGVLVLCGLRHVSSPGTDRGGRPAGARRGTRTELAEGLRYLRGHPVVRPLLVGGTVLNFCSAAYFAVFVLWVVGPGSRVGLAAEAYGALLAALAVGAVAGAVLAEPLGRRVPEMTLIGASWLVNSACLAVPVLVPHPVAIAAAFVVVGVSNTVGNVVGQALRQRLVPLGLLGRVGGVSRTVSYGSMPLGAALGGLVGQLAGLPAVFVGAVAVSVAAVVWVLRVAPQRVLDVFEASADGRSDSETQYQENVRSTT